MTRLPRFIKIGKYKLTVRRPVKIKWPNDDGEPRQVQAYYSYGKRTIDIKRGLQHPIAQDVLAHELGHAVWEYVGLHEHRTIMNYEEQVISAFMPTFLDLLRDNPKLVEFLMDKEKCG